MTQSVQEAAAWSVERAAVLEWARRELPAYLLRQRWYPAKDVGEPAVALARLIPWQTRRASEPAALATWNVTPPGRAPMTVFMPLALCEDPLPADDLAVIGRPPPAWRVPRAGRFLIVDALSRDGFVREFVGLMVSPRQVAPSPAIGVLPESEGVQPGRTSRFDGDALGPADTWRIRRSKAEQSNTSIRIGDAALLKVIRKVAGGLHPELEMGRFLTEEAHYDAIPPLLGWMNLGTSTIAILQGFVANEGDGWGWTQDHLAHGPAEQQIALDWIGRLGGVTARMHRALGAATGDPAFDPEPATAGDWARWRDEVEAMAGRALEGLAHVGNPLLAGRRERLMAMIRDLAAAAPPVAKTRHHGDFHLGQVLVHGEEAVIVDFEGEPLRPLAERRAKHVPLRDVAGMLRSIGYAAAVAARERQGSSAELADWARRAQRAFLDHYLEAAGVSRATALPLVRFFTLEKALYEVLYELANRPDWVDIPVAAVNDLLEGDRRAFDTRHGATLLPDGGVRFRLWAPACEHIDLEIGTGGAAGVGGISRFPMGPCAGGWFELDVPDARPGTRYRFVLPDGLRIPDPASRFQPDDVHGASEVIDPKSHVWRTAWAGRPWHEAVVYELHVGSFTAEGTFRAAIGRLEHLAGLGVTAIELMPIGDFPGGRNWGYDGVLPYAPDSAYGRPEDLKDFVDAAHARGIMMLLDVVYNHFGPDGNYLPRFAPAFFTERHHTPWGAAVNYDGKDSAPVRDFVIENALYWLVEYGFDGLRLDAVHAIIDDGDPHLLVELAERVRAVVPGAQLILENEENEASRLRRLPDGLLPEFTAQWNDDLHHVLHVAATGERQGYYADYAGAAPLLGRALAEGFAFQGETMAFRGSPRGSPSAALPPTAFVAFIQNHDQIGNRAFGERITELAPAAAVRAIASVYLLLPQIPMLFMGEEWGAAQPFPFFCDFDGELAEAVRRGRRAEFAKFPEFQDPAVRDRIPDPQAEATFRSAKLDWNALEGAGHAGWLDLYTRLLTVRRESIVPLLPHIGAHAGRHEEFGPGGVRVRWGSDVGSTLWLTANLSGAVMTLPSEPGGDLLWEEGGAIGQPWSVRWTLT
jgi:malto-oligosyltrehalose trehalohydrolase